MLSKKLHEYEANEGVEPLKFKDPFELCLKVKWTKRRRLIGVKDGETMAVSDDLHLMLRWHKDPGVDSWDDNEYERLFSWHSLAQDEISGRVNRRLMFATLFMYEWFPERGDNWLNELDILAREVK